MKFVMSEESVTICFDGKVRTVYKEAPNFKVLCDALKHKDYELALCALEDHVAAWSRGRFTLNGNAFMFDDKPLPVEFNKRLIDTASEGVDPEPLFKFQERLAKNPSPRSREQCYRFLAHIGLPIVADGCFLAYKGVREDYLDKWTGKIDNRPGRKHEMDRDLVSDDPEIDCHFGFHVGSEKYACGYGPRCVICKVAPEDVVCVPNDYACQKMRVCRYEVIGNYGATLPSTVFNEPKYETEVCYYEMMSMSPAQLAKMPVDKLQIFINSNLKVIGTEHKSNSSLELAELAATLRTVNKQ